MAEKEKRPPAPTLSKNLHKKQYSTASLGDDHVPVYKSTASLLSPSLGQLTDENPPQFTSQTNLVKATWYQRSWKKIVVYSVLTFLLVVGILTIVLVFHYKAKDLEYTMQTATLTGEYATTSDG